VYTHFEDWAASVEKSLPYKMIGTFPLETYPRLCPSNFGVRKIAVGFAWKDDKSISC
jgi:hypothetical protein